LLYKLSEEAKRSPNVLPEVQRLQGIIAQADHVMAKASIAGTKAMLGRLHGYGGAPRKPLPAMDVDEAEKLWNHVYVQELIKLEREISTA